jgi:hypothetical protein
MPSLHFGGSAAPQADRPFSHVVPLFRTGGFVGFIIATKLHDVFLQEVVTSLVT